MHSSYCTAVAPFSQYVLDSMSVTDIPRKKAAGDTACLQRQVCISWACFPRPNVVTTHRWTGHCVKWVYLSFIEFIWVYLSIKMSFIQCLVVHVVEAKQAFSKVKKRLWCKISAFFIYYPSCFTFQKQNRHSPKQSQLGFFCLIRIPCLCTSNDMCNNIKCPIARILFRKVHFWS